MAADAPDHVAGECATGRLLTIAPQEPLGAAIRFMRCQGVSRLMVAEPERRLPLGILTTLDVARAVAQGIPSVEALHVRVRAGIEPADMTVLLPADHERGRAVLAEHLEDLAVMLGLAGVVRADDQAVAGLGAKDGL